MAIGQSALLGEMVDATIEQGELAVHKLQQHGIPAAGPVPVRCLANASLGSWVENH